MQLGSGIAQIEEKDVQMEEKVHRLNVYMEKSAQIKCPDDPELHTLNAQMGKSAQIKCTH